jgi:phosphocarrier protein HPr
VRGESNDLGKKGNLSFEGKVTLTNEVGLHARPAAEFVMKAASFKCTVKVLKDGNEADAKSITSILFLDVRKGDMVTIRATGEDAERAIKTLTKLVEEFK